MLNLTDIRAYLNADKVDVTKTSYLNALANGVSDYMEHYLNIEVNSESPKGLLLICADMVSYQFSIRPDLKELRTEDMELVYSTKYPDNITTRLNSYRKLKW